MRGKLRFLLLALIVLQVGAGWWWAVREAEEREVLGRERLQRRLERISKDMRPETFMERAADRLFRGLWQTGSPRPLRHVIRSWRVSCPVSMAEVYFFDRQGRVLGSHTRALKEGVQNLFDISVRTDWLEVDVRTLPETKKAISLLHGGLPYVLMGREGSLFRFGEAKHRSWGIWRRAPASSKRLTAAVLILFHDQGVTDEKILEIGMRKARRDAMTVGVIDRAASPSFALPPWLDRDTARNLVMAFFRPAAIAVGSSAGQPLLTAAPGRKILVGKPPSVKPVLPLWIWAGLFLWVPWVIRPGTEENHSGRFPLGVFLGAVVGISAGIPLAITVAFWLWFAEGRERFVRAEEMKRLEAIVISLDQEFPALMRRWKMVYRRWFAEVQANGDIETFLERARRWELARGMDTKYIVASQGARIGDFSASCINVRSLALAPKPVRKRFIASLVDKCYHPYAREAGLIWNFASGTPIGELLNLDLFNNATMASVAAAIAKEAIQRNDRERGFEVEEDKGDSMSALVLSSILDTQGGNPAQLFAALLGTFGFSSRGDVKTAIYPDVIRDGTGRGRYFSLFFHQLQTLESRYWREVYRARHRWPADLSLSAVSWFELAFSYPNLYEHRSWRHLRRNLEPPQRLLSGTDPRNGNLFAALACRNPAHYFLIASRPGGVIRSRMESLRRRLGAIALTMMAILAVLVWRLRSAALVPTRQLLEGIAAMERKQFDARVEIRTGDEWEALAATFNHTLTEMKELEVASLIQSRILLAKPLSGAGFRFLGTNVMASQVGGDYYDARLLGDDRMAFTIGDVSGHGVSAALVTGMARAAFHSLLRSGTSAPASLLKTMNEVLMANLKRTKMMTLFTGIAHAGGRIVISNAGHPYPYLLGRKGDATPVKQNGFPLGTRLKAAYIDLEVRLEPGEKLVLYSDGVSEAISPESNQFGYERLLETMKGISRRRLSAEELIVDLQKQLRDFTREEPWGDDVTIAVLERLS